MRETVCWPRSSELYHSERLTENQFYPRNLKGDWKGRAHFGSSQKYKAREPQLRPGEIIANYISGSGGEKPRLSVGEA